MHKLELLKEAKSGDSRQIQTLPEKLAIPNHSWVSVTVQVGLLKFLPDKLIISGGRGLRVTVNRRYTGEPITLYGECLDA